MAQHSSEISHGGSTFAQHGTSTTSAAAKRRQATLATARNDSDTTADINIDGLQQQAAVGSSDMPQRQQASAATGRWRAHGAGRGRQLQGAWHGARLRRAAVTSGEAAELRRVGSYRGPAPATMAVGELTGAREGAA